MRLLASALAIAALVSPFSHGAWASQAISSEPVRITRPQLIRIVPMPLDNALELFRAACIETFPDPSAFDHAVETLDMGFERSTDVAPGTRQWREGERYFTLETASGRQGCSFRVAVTERFSRPELIMRIGTAVAPDQAVTDRTFFAYWDLGQTGCRIEYLPASEDSRVFTLMLRAGERGDC
ncbi:MAG: hypothetical protein KF780_04760 [Sphingomonas sp.]|nr:hypothetical protein [Sphingomonas sp.]